MMEEVSNTSNSTSVLETQNETSETVVANRKQSQYVGDWVGQGLKECPGTNGEADRVFAAKRFIEGLNSYEDVKGMLLSGGISTNDIARYIRTKSDGKRKSKSTVAAYVYLYRKYCVVITAADVVQSVRHITADPSSGIKHPEALKRAAWEPIFDSLAHTANRMIEVEALEESLQIQRERIRMARNIETQQFKGMLWQSIDKANEVLVKTAHELREMKMDLGIYARVPRGVDLTVRRGVDERFKNLNEQERKVLSEFGTILMQAVTVTPQAEPAESAN